MTEIVDISGAKHDVDCIACAIQGGEIELPVERIAQTEHFVVEQDLEYPIEGFCIIASKRHIKSILEFNEEEQAEFLPFVMKCRDAMKEKLGIENVTVVQEEATSSSHFHVWLFPWHAWMGGKKKISEIAGVMNMAKYQRSTETELARVREASQKLKEYFSENN